ncbi:MAG: hypothetical protein HY080_16980 [Gammaproteobacteria bacterium]|nr:hypothetical protein [Gammaproteobacteria bacterium]
MNKYGAILSMLCVIGHVNAVSAEVSEEECAEIVNKTCEDTLRQEKKFGVKLAVNGSTVEELRAIQKKEGSCKALNKIQHPDY